MCLAIPKHISFGIWRMYLAIRKNNCCGILKMYLAIAFVQFISAPYGSCRPPSFTDACSWPRSSSGCPRCWMRASTMIKANVEVKDEAWEFCRAARPNATPRGAVYHSSIITLLGGVLPIFRIFDSLVR